MTQDFSSSAGTPPNPAPDPSGSTSGRHDLRTLRRSRDDRMIGGVCGGLGRYAGIDPIIFRIVLAALAVFGGVGLLLYALGWLLIPEEGSDVSELHRLLRGHGSPLPIIAAIVIGFLGLLAFVDVVNHRPAGQFALLLIVLAVVAVIALTRRAGNEPPTASATPPTSTPPMYTPPPTPQYAAAQSAAPQYSPPPQSAPFAAPPQSAPFAAPPHYTAPLGPPAGFSPSRPMYTPPPGYVPPPPKPPRPPSILGPLAISVGIVVIGVLFALDASHTIEISAQTIFAASLLTVGLALVVGTWIGRGRVLIAFGVVLTIALALAAAIDVPLRGGIGSRDSTPTSIAEIPSAYHLGIGRQSIDLTGLQLAGKTVHVTAEVGIGRLWVNVPANVKVVVRGRAGTGSVDVNGSQVGGTHLDRTLLIPTSGTPTPGEIDLDLRVGFGEVSVVQGVALDAPVTPPVPALATPTAPAAPEVIQP
ncbi:MAG TPA: PspC domain-containing protein [Acidothermaceae bacterium]